MSWVMNLSKFKLHECVKAIRVCLKQGAPFAPSIYLCIAITPKYSSAEPAANTLPVIDKVSAGDVSVSQSASVLDINQSSSRAIVDWQSFDLGRDATVRFNQPSSSSSTLNRINGNNASQIFGRIEAPGEVILVNPYGLYFSRTAKVDVGSIIASVNRISAENYLSGNYLFERDGATGSIVNDGDIRASLGGYIAMLAPEVRNNGVLLAQMGTIALGASDRVSLNFGPNSKLNSLTASQSTIDALIENKSAVEAPGGLIILSARGVSEIARGVINNSGSIDLSDGGLDFVNEGGRLLISGDHVTLAPAQKIEASIDSDVVLTAANQQAGAIDISAVETVTVSGEINASADAAGTVSIAAGERIELNNANILAEGDANGGEIFIKSINRAGDSSSTSTVLALNGSTRLSVASEQGEGGMITLQGDAISLNDTTSLIATGATGGGNVLVGGDWQGGAREEYRVFNDPDALYQATNVSMQGNAFIDASASENGDGGTIVLWSDVSNPQSVTTVSGSLFARGGQLSGDGGYIETSGASLNFEGITLSTLAANGDTGEWLIDPTDINGSDGSNGKYTIDTDAEVSAITSALAGADVRVLSVGDLNIAKDIVSNSNTTLTLESTGSTVFLKADVTAGSITILGYEGIESYSKAPTLEATSDGGNVILSTNYTGLGDGYFLVKPDGALTIKTNGGNVYFGGGNVSGSGYIDPGFGDVSAFKNEASLNIVTNGGDVSFKGKSLSSGNTQSVIYFYDDTTINTDGGAATFEGISSMDRGVNFKGDFDLTSKGGEVTIIGSGGDDTDDAGVLIQSSSFNVITEGGDFTLTGSSGTDGLKTVKANSNISVKIDTSGATGSVGGDIKFDTTTTGKGAKGFYFNSRVSMNSGTGKISLEGVVDSSVGLDSTSASGVFADGFTHELISASTASDAISILGLGGYTVLELGVWECLLPLMGVV